MREWAKWSIGDVTGKRGILGRDTYVEGREGRAKRGQRRDN